MAILEVRPDAIVALSKTTLVDQKLRERADLQRLLRASISLVAPDVLVIAEEFGHWEDSRRRIDLLALDRDANLVVIELKRTEDGGHMELQALRYAAMVSIMTFDQVVEAHGDYLATHNSDADPRDAILEFLQWEDVDEASFAQDVRIVLVSVDFSKEITTTVLWLTGRGLDIRCVRLTPYRLADRVLLDVQQVIPLPEAAEFQTKVREKERTTAVAKSTRDRTRFNVRMGPDLVQNLPKRHAMLQLFRYLSKAGVGPEDVVHAISFRNPERTIRRYEGEVSAGTIADDLLQRAGGARGTLHPSRWFCSDEDLIRFKGATYIVNNQWGHHTDRAINNIISAFPQHAIEVEPVTPGHEE